MLTKQDLKAIGDIIDLKLESKLEEKLESKLEEKLESKLEEKLESKLHIIRQDISNIKTNLGKLQKDMTGVKKDIKEIKKNTERDFGFHESHNRHVVSHVQKIQKYLGLAVMPTEPPVLNNF